MTTNHSPEANWRPRTAEALQHMLTEYLQIADAAQQLERRADAWAARIDAVVRSLGLDFERDVLGPVMARRGR